MDSYEGHGHIKATQLTIENDPNKAISGELTLAKADSEDSWNQFWADNEDKAEEAPPAEAAAPAEGE